MRITITGASTEDKSKKVELTLEYKGGTVWRLEVGKSDFLVNLLEDAMAFVKEKSEVES